jgi:hypothetical protein
MPLIEAVMDKDIFFGLRGGYSDAEVLLSCFYLLGCRRLESTARLLCRSFVPYLGSEHT